MEHKPITQSTQSTNQLINQSTNQPISMTLTSKGAFLPGNSTVVFKDVEFPTPGHGEVLLKVKSSTICGSDIRAIYREHLGKGPEG